jgi:predicted nucleic-acid-binding protein
VIGLGTNVLVRILTADDRAQTEHAARFIRERCSSASPGFVNSIVLTELVWVLGSLYDYGRSDIARAVDALLASRDLAIERAEQVRSALRLFRAGNCDFVDAFIGEVNRVNGCEATATFDRKAARLRDFIQIA